MPGKQVSQRNIAEEIDALRKKITLLEGDRKAYYEGAEWTMKMNREEVSKLRKENDELRKVKSDKSAADEHVIKKGLENYPAERKSLKNKPGSVAIEKMDEKVRDRYNVLNKERDKTIKLQRKLKDLTTHQTQMVKDASDAVATDAGESTDAQMLRTLENRLDKSNLKCQEAKHINRTYLQIKDKLEEEHHSFELILDEKEQEIKKLKGELKELQVMKNDASIARNVAKSQLEEQEKEVYSERRRRELELQKVRKEAEEKKKLVERYQHRIQARSSLNQEDSTLDQQKQQDVEEEYIRFTSHEDVFRYIKEATGVSDTQEVVARFRKQGERHDQLEEMRVNNERQRARLQEEKERLQQEFEDMKYTGEAKLSSGQRLLEEIESETNTQQEREVTSREQLQKSSKILTNVKCGIEHLAMKLSHLKAMSSQVQKAKISQASDEYVLDQLSVSEEKVLKLLEEIDQTGRDIADISKQIEDEEFRNVVEMKLPTYNTRVKLPQSAKDIMYDDDEDSGEDEDMLTRGTIKKQSQQIVDAKTRRGRPGKRKKKTK